MEIIKIKSKNQEELNEKIKKIISLEKDETTVVKEIKKPFKFLFLSFNGEYEVRIVKKTELQKENKSQKKETIKKNTQVKENEDKVLKKLKVTVKEFLALSNLNVKIKEIKFQNFSYKVELEGEDAKYIIGEKGKTLSSLEYLFSLMEEFKGIKIYFDSNNYKEKREKILRDLAKKHAKTILKTKKKIKLNPMSSRERKIIHEEISKIDNLETISVGVEPKRYLIIKYKENK